MQCKCDHHFGFLLNVCLIIPAHCKNWGFALWRNSALYPESRGSQRPRDILVLPKSRCLPREEAISRSVSFRDVGDGGVFGVICLGQRADSRNEQSRFLPWRWRQSVVSTYTRLRMYICSPWGSVKVDLWVCGAIGRGTLGAVFYSTRLLLMMPILR